MTLIDGKAISEQVKQEIAAEVAEIVARGGKRPHLAAILVGHDGGSETYVAAKVKACEICGFLCDKWAGCGEGRRNCKRQAFLCRPYRHPCVFLRCEKLSMGN